MPNHVSIRRHFEFDKLVLSFQFYKEYQTADGIFPCASVKNYPRHMRHMA